LCPGCSNKEKETMISGKEEYFVIKIKDFIKGKLSFYFKIKEIYKL
jgi:hypothetical protein